MGQFSKFYLKKTTKYCIVFLDSAAKNKDASPGSNLYKVGMFYSLGHGHHKN